MCYRMPPNAFLHEIAIFWSAKKRRKDTFFPTIHPLSPVIFATATVVAFVLLRNSRFNFHYYTQHEATPTQKSARKWRCDLSRLLARKNTKGIHSSKPALLNRPIQRIKKDNFWKLLAVSRGNLHFWVRITLLRNDELFNSENGQ